MDQIITLTDLPTNIQEQIPMSIRSMSNRYYLSALPPKIQELIREYLDYTVDVQYDNLYDFKPSMSKYSDISTTKTIKETIVNYIRNYLYVTPGAYPFDPVFGCKLKYHLQTKDTELRRVLITDEINKIINVLSADLGLPINIVSISINPISSALQSVVKCSIVINVPGEEDVKVEYTEEVDRAV